MTRTALKFCAERGPEMTRAEAEAFFCLLADDFFRWYASQRLGRGQPRPAADLDASDKSNKPDTHADMENHDRDFRQPPSGKAGRA